MTYCAVPGCRNKSKESNSKFFFKIPDKEANVIKSHYTTEPRRSAWLRAIWATKYPESIIEKMVICSKHFVTGRPADDSLPFHVDWIPSVNIPSVVPDRLKSLDNIITNLPEVCEDYDVPDYEPVVNEKKIESDLIHKYMSNPICGENGCYNDDHDYLGLPLLRKKTESPLVETTNDHNYSFREGPACRYFDCRHFCNICQCNRTNLFNYNTHMTMHTLQNDVTCEICCQTFLTTTCLNNHLTTHTSQCEICFEEIPIVHINGHRQANLRQKLEFFNKYRSNDKSGLICVVCSKTFRTRDRFSGHMNSHKTKEKMDL